jgi:hypothetical protein
MDAEVYKEMLKNARNKREAFSLESVDELKRLIAATDCPSGDVAEIILAFMLGMFSRLFGDGMRVFMTAPLDVKGEDFRIVRFEIPYSIQLKWNKKNDKVYPPHIKVIEVGASPAFKGERYLPAQRGYYMFYDFLAKSGAYEEDELWTFDEKHPELADIFDEAWEIIKT